MTETQQKSACGIVLVIAAILAVLLLAGFLLLRLSSYMLIEAVIVGDTGPVTSSKEWPRPLTELVADSRRSDVDETDRFSIDESSLQIYCLCHGMDEEYVWRMDASPGLFEHIQEEWSLTQIENPNWPVLHGKSNLSGVPTPSWWSPKRDADTSFYVCPQTLARDKGDRFNVAFDKKRGVIFVRYWFNF